MVKLLVEYSMKAGYTLQILNNMDRTYNMRVQEQQNESEYLLRALFVVLQFL